MIRIKGLTVSREGDMILRDVSMEIITGEKILLIGANGSGKTSLARVLMGDPLYTVISGSIDVVKNPGSTEKVTDLLSLDVHERARRGLFVSFQVPVELPGVSAYEFLHAAYRSLHEKDAHIKDIDDLAADIDNLAKTLGISPAILHRGVNEGFSGGERKKLELLQMLILKPRYVILDEPDSGMDVDAVRKIAEVVEVLDPEVGVLLISHDAQRIGIKKFDRIFIMEKGHIGRVGGMELVEEVARKGYETHAA